MPRDEHTGRVPLAPEDRAILELECPTVAGHTCKVVRLGAGSATLEEIRQRVDERIVMTPALTRRLGGSTADPYWEPDTAFDVERHVVAFPTAGVDENGLLAVVSELFEERLDRSRPLWRIDAVPTSDGGTALVWRVHHAVGDGTTVLRYAQLLLWDDPNATAVTVEQAQPSQAADDARRRRHLASLLRREFAGSRRRSPFDGLVGTRRQVAFATLSLPALHDAARTLDGATVNDALLSVVAGALRSWLQRHHRHLDPLQVRVPVSLHHEGDTALNRDSFFSLRLPLGEPDPGRRLRAVHRQTRARKEGHDAERREVFLHDLATVSPHLERFTLRFEQSPHRFALAVSNIRGPSTRVALLQTEVSTLHSLAEIGERHALRISAISFADLLCIGFCADPALVADVSLMAEAVGVEASALLAEASCRPGPT